MQYRNLIGFIMLALFFISSSYKSKPIPDPVEYAKKLLLTIKKKDRQAYLDSFYVNDKDVKWIIDKINNQQYISPEDKQKWTQQIEDTTTLSGANRRVYRSYDNIEEWIIKDTIDVSALEYISTLYEMDYEGRIDLYLVAKMKIYVKHKEKYFTIVVKDAAYANGRWALGRVREIYITDEYMHEKYYAYNTSGVSMDSTVVAVDSVAIAPAAPLLTKKQQKIQNKIDALDKKRYKLYEELELSY